MRFRIADPITLKNKPYGGIHMYGRNTKDEQFQFISTIPNGTDVEEIWRIASQIVDTTKFTEYASMNEANMMVDYYEKERMM